MLKFIAPFLLLFSFVYATNNVDSLIVKLENTMEKRLEFDAKKEKLINNYKSILNDSSLDAKTRFQITKKLIYELEFYSFDSALYYTLEIKKLADSISDIDVIIDSKILLAKILVESGRYKESLDVLNEINRKEVPNKLRINYFYALKEVYSELSFYSSIPSNKELYYQNYLKLRDSLSLLLPKNSDEFLRIKEKELRDNRLLEEALKVNEKRLKGKIIGSRDFSLITFERSLLHGLANNREEEKKYLILSAISDIKASVKDNASLSRLAMMLYEEKKIFKAHQYINFSLDDAEFFNSKLRFINLSNILPVITEAYEKESRIQKNKLTKSLIFISVLAVFLLFTIVFGYKQYKRLSEARIQLDKANTELNKVNTQLNLSNDNLNKLYKELLEANLIKEKYIGTFLNLYSDYINKLDIYRKLVKKYVTLNKIDELKKMSNSKQVVDTEMKLFHKNFDESFLQIYPNFIDDFNKLLKVDKRVVVKKSELLNTELRIFALIRLGITKSEQISKILRYSVSTIYNYRVKLRNNALKGREFFENDVKNIS